MQDKELRLALVCYGGISLAIYMHGITKEIWHLARASRAHRDFEPAGGASERVYHALLDEIGDTAGINLRVMVDIVAGASAGGINSVFLAQAVSTGQSLDPLTDLWLEIADVETLLDPGQGPSHRLAKIWALPIAWMLAGRDAAVDGTVEPAAQAEVRAKLERFVRSRWFEPPFGGKQLMNMLLDALETMRDAPAGPRLLPDGQPLDLFVTVTDFHGHPQRLALNSPPEVVETEHRLVFSFSDHGDAAAPLANAAELAFAARATSSFPGAFPPATVAEVDQVLAARGTDWPGRAAFLEHALPRHFAAGVAESAPLIDGSVLANAPFRPAIDALRERPARRQIDRRFVFIDPTPGYRIAVAPGSGDAAPGFFRTILGALSELPRQQPIRDNLEAIGQRSAQIERMLAIIERLRGEVEAQVESLFGYTLFLDYPTPKRLAGWRARAQQAASTRAGYGHAAYGLLKVEGVADRIATHLNQIADLHGAERWQRMRSAVGAEIARRGADSFSIQHSGAASVATLDLLRAHDLGFRIRRLRLLARRVSELDVDHARAELVPIRTAIYESLAGYLECQRADPFLGMRESIRSPDCDVGAVMDELAARMDLRTLDDDTDIRLSEGFSHLPRDLRRPMLLAYLGFPFFDIATLPLLRGEGLNEFDPIRVDRISPDDATAIRSGGAQATLKGIQFHNFGAFFSRAYRENDYLWGRLHGADRLVDIILSTLPAGKRLGAGRIATIKRALFHAILDEEEPRLQAVPGLVAQLRTEIG
ncbi:patatin-related protein [Sphingomonas sp. BE123]|uniref:patatin-like protein n=1 Tax=unclassified Sphingomonas TaxID=196159 RepID=UPI00285D06F8|nr:patatin-like protein [Sphingomonas sp. BE123]MDR6850951.1 patatin-related protein [Sphingomonas sp. BE123]